MEEPITIIVCVAILSGVINVVKKAIPEVGHKYIPLGALVAGIIIAAVWGYTMEQMPGWATIVMNGLIVGLSATGAYETVKTHGANNNAN